MKHKVAIIAIILGLTTLTLRAYYGNRGGDVPAITTEAVTRGAIVPTISATGTLEALTTVQVGSQVSGSIHALNADFNSIVRRGQVLARLDPSLFRSAVEQAQANVVRAEADVERMRVMTQDAEAKYRRARELSEKQLIAAVELDAAEVAVRTAQAQVRSAEAQVTQARASLRQAAVNLEKTIITSPIDGIVIARNVDAGQTVAASLQAPVLFEIAADLTQMQLKANIDESDVGAVRPGQSVRFTVDAHPGETFAGRVEQVRLNPVVEQNVVTYAAIVSAANPGLKLMPGMTATLTVEVARNDDALRVPNAALRFRPSEDVLMAYGLQPLPPGRIEEGVATVWHYVDGTLRPVRVRTGLSDATFTEVVEGDLALNAQVVTRASAGVVAGASPSGTASPLMPAGRR
jgi:HlyD family secretion protein